jgi:hypothetical protein
MVTQFMRPERQYSSSIHKERGSALIQFSILLGVLCASGMYAYMSGLSSIFAKTDSQAKIMAAADTLLTNTSFEFLQMSGGQIGFLPSNAMQTRMDQVRIRVNDSLSEVKSVQGVNYEDTCVAAYYFSSSSICGDAPSLITTSSNGCNGNTDTACDTYLREMRTNSQNCGAESKHICAVLQYTENGLSKNLIVSKRPTIQNFLIASASESTTFYTSVLGTEGNSNGNGGSGDTGNGDSGPGTPIGDEEPENSCIGNGCEVEPPVGSGDSALEPVADAELDPFEPNGDLGGTTDDGASHNTDPSLNDFDSKILESNDGIAGEKSQLWFD